MRILGAAVNGTRADQRDAGGLIASGRQNDDVITTGAPYVDDIGWSNLSPIFICQTQSKG